MTWIPYCTSSIWNTIIKIFFSDHCSIADAGCNLQKNAYIHVVDLKTENGKCKLTLSKVQNNNIPSLFSENMNVL